MADDELEAIRARRLAEIQKQQRQPNQVTTTILYKMFLVINILNIIEWS